MNEINIIKTIQKRRERKVIFVGLSNLVFDCVASIDMGNWTILLNALIENYSYKRNYKLRRMNMNEGNTENEYSFQKLSVYSDSKVQFIY